MILFKKTYGITMHTAHFNHNVIVTSETDLNKYIPPSQEFPKIGDIFRFGRDETIDKRFYLIMCIGIPQKGNGDFLPYEMIHLYDFSIGCITFVWNEETSDFSLNEPIDFNERWFWRPLVDGVPKFIRVAHASDLYDDPRMSFLTEKWLAKNSKNEWVAKGLEGTRDTQ